MAITTSGEIKLSDIFKDANETSNEPGANDNLTLDTFSDSYENAAQVGQGIANQTGSTTQIRAEFAADTDRISHFYGAALPGQFQNIALYIGSVTTGNLISNKDTTLVGTETLVVATDNPGHDGNGGAENTAKATIVQSNGSALSGTNSNITATEGEDEIANDSGEYNITLSSVNLDNSNDGSTVKIKVEDDDNAFDSNFSGNFTYRDKISGGAISLTASPTSVTDAQDSCTVTMGTSTSEGTVINVANTAVSAVTSGDGGTIGGSVIEADETAQIAVSNTPGVIQVSTDLRGNPTTNSSARNRQTGITNTISIPFTRQIKSVQSQGINTYLTGTSVTMQATSRGVNGINMKLGYGTSNSNSTFTDSQDKSISDSRYSQDTQTQAFTINHSSPNSSTSRESYYSKAEYTSGTATTTAGSLFLINPNLVYSKTGNKTVDVNGSAQTFSATLTSGYNAGMTIETDFSGVSDVTGYGNNMSITPSTNNGVFTITYTGTADLNSNNVTTSTLTVRPTIALSADTNTVFALPETGDQPTGTYAQNVTLTTSEVGANGTSQYNWSFPPELTGWEIVSGGGSTDDSVTGNFSSGLRENSGTEDISITLTKNGATSTSDSETITITILDNQALSNFNLLTGTTVRRGDSNGISFTFKYKNIETVDISFPLVSQGNSSANSLQANLNVNGDASPNTLLTHSTVTKNVPEFSVSTTGLYRVNVRDDADLSPQVYSSSITVKDKVPSTPGNFSTTSGGYSGTQAIAWSSGGYQVRYKVYRATTSGGSYSLISTQTGTSYSITADSNNTSNFFYKVLAENDNSYVDNNGGASTSDEQSSYNNATNYIIFPVGANSKNVITGNNTIIRSTLNNSTSTSHTFSTPTNATDAASIVSYAYSRSSGTSVNSSITNSTSATATVNAAGTGTGTSVINLTTTLEGGNESDTTCSSNANITVYHYPKINPIANGSGLNNGVSIGTVRAGLDIINAQSGIRVDYQGYRKASSTDLTIRARIVKAGTTTVITVDNYIAFGSSGDFADSHLSARDVYAFDLVGNFQEITSTTATSGTLQFQFVNQNTSDPNSGTWWDIETFSITQPEDWLLYQGRPSSTSTTITGIYANTEQAYLDTSTASNNDVQVFPASAGAPTVGDDLLVLQADGGYSTVSSTGFVSIYRTAGSSTYARYVLQIGSNGNIDAIFNTSQITPRAPSSLTNSVTANSGGATPTVQLNWTRNSSHNTAVEIQGRDLGGSYSTLYTESAATTSKSFTETNHSAPSTNLSTSVISGTQINLSWSISGHDSFTVTFGTGGSYTNGGTLATSGTSYNHTSLNAGVTYYYKITATKNGKQRQYKVRNTRSANSSGYQNSAYVTGDETISLGNRVTTDQESATTTAPTLVLQISDVVYVNDSDNIATSAGGSTVYYNGQTWSTSENGTQRLSAVIPSGMSTAVNGNVTVSVANFASNLMKYNIQDTSVESLSTSAGGWSGWATSHAIAADSVTNKRIYYRMKGTCPGTPTGNQQSDTMTIAVSATGATDDSNTATLTKNAAAGGGCFIAGTPVLMSNGTIKNIEDIVVGDVLSSMTIDGMTLDGDWDSYKDFTTNDISSSSLSTADVESVRIYEDHLLSKRISLSNGETMTVTAYHPLFVYRDGNYIWVKPEEEFTGDNVLLSTDKLVNKDKQLITIQSMEDISDSVNVYTLDVEDLDVYFVNGVLVHNKEEGP